MLGLTLHPGQELKFDVQVRDAKTLARSRLLSFVVEVFGRVKETWTLIDTLHYTENPALGKYVFTYTVPSLTGGEEELRFRFKTVTTGEVQEIEDRVYLYHI